MAYCLNYECDLQHHEHDEIKLMISHSAIAEDVVAEILVTDGGGYSGSHSRVCLTAAALREITFFVNKYIDARRTMQTEDTQDDALLDI